MLYLIVLSNHMQQPTSPKIRRDNVFELYSPLIKPLALSLKSTLPDSIDAEDLCATAALALLQVADGLEFYVRQRLHGAMTDSIRGANYKAATSLSIEEESVSSRREFAVQPAVVESIDSRRRTVQVVAAIKLLPGEERKVIEMRLRGAPVAEIARRTGSSKRTVLRRSSDAVVGIRAAIAA